MKTILTCMVVALWISACDQPSTHAANALAPRADEATRVAYSVYGRPAAVEQAFSPKERHNLMLKTTEVFRGHDRGTDYGEVIHSGLPLIRKDAIVAALFADYPGVEWLMLRQMAAAPMLELHKRAGSRDLAAIDRYARVLVEGESPDAELMAYALPLLAERWGAARIAEAAQATQAASEAWLARNCADCTARLAAERTSATDAPAHKARAIAEGYQALADLADA